MWADKREWDGSAFLKNFHLLAKDGKEKRRIGRPIIVSLYCSSSFSFLFEMP